jgi:hypothetical protein
MKAKMKDGLEDIPMAHLCMSFSPLQLLWSFGCFRGLEGLWI